MRNTSEQTLLRGEVALSYNPGYQSVLKELKHSTRQRFVAIEFGYPDAAIERKIVARETGVDAPLAERLVTLAGMTRSLKGNGLDEGASTRLLVHAGKVYRRLTSGPSGQPRRMRALPNVQTGRAGCARPTGHFDAQSESLPIHIRVS